MIRESLGVMINTFLIALFICLIAYILILKADIKACNNKNQKLEMTFEILQKENIKKEAEYKKRYNMAVESLEQVEEKIEKVNSSTIGATCEDSIEWLKKQAIKEGE